MNNKIDVAKLLKGCPSGMGLDCTMYENVYFDQIYGDDGCPYSIGCYTIADGIRTSINFTKFGTFSTHMNSKCAIFPKGKTTWGGFIPPCKFKDGDVVTDIDGAIFIYKGVTTCGYCGSFASLDRYNQFISHYESYLTDCIRLATKEEKQKLFDAIKANGYKWNAETKALKELIVPKFKVGDRIKRIVGKEEIATVVGVKESFYNLDSKVGTYAFSISLQHEWELVPDKFDISTLVPFESKVLVRDKITEKWKPAIWGLYDDDVAGYPYGILGGNLFSMCIPYVGNEHLRGTANDCDKYYKTWEGK